jgi:hypothetical protein
MKKIVFLFSIPFLFQSCFSYRIDTKPTEMIVGKKYKIERNHKTTKGILKSINDSTAVVVLDNLAEKQIPLKEITQAKRRKFSIVRTVALPITIVAGITLLYVASNPSPVEGMGPIQFPNK